MIPKLLYICFNNNSPVLQCSISYITQHGTVFHSFENSSFKDHSLGELILENKVINSFSIAFYKHHNLYTLQDERNFVKIIDEKFANSYINSNEFTYTISESEEVIIYNFLDGICYGFNEGELYIKNVVKYIVGTITNIIKNKI